MEYVNTIDALSQVPTQMRGALSPVEGVNKGCINRPAILNIDITFRSMEELKCDALRGSRGGSLLITALPGKTRALVLILR